jgi:hypothetical protein
VARTSNDPDINSNPSKPRKNLFMVVSERADVIVGAPVLYHDNRGDRVECDKGSRK